jgi:hypothetical protein
MTLEPITCSECGHTIGMQESTVAQNILCLECANSLALLMRALKLFPDLCRDINSVTSEENFKLGGKSKLFRSLICQELNSIFGREHMDKTYQETFTTSPISLDKGKDNELLSLLVQDDDNAN